MAINNLSKQAGSLAAACGVVWLLSACGGGVSGEFYNGDGILTIDGDSVTFTDFTCSDSDGSAELDSERQFEGELTEDGAQVMWDVENQSAYSWTPAPSEPIVENSSGEQITIGDQQFKKMGQEEALKQYSTDEC